jgi:hypothetical protein
VDVNNCSRDRTIISVGRRRFTAENARGAEILRFTTENTESTEFLRFRILGASSFHGYLL